MKAGTRELAGLRLSSNHGLPDGATFVAGPFQSTECFWLGDRRPRLAVIHPVRM
jgi:hypothetical protein